MRRRRKSEMSEVAAELTVLLDQLEAAVKIVTAALEEEEIPEDLQEGK